MAKKFKVGSKVVAICGSDYVRKGDHGVVVSKCSDGYWVKWDNPLQTCSDNCWHIAPEDIQRLATSVQKFSLTNTKINVQKYADDNGLTLATACKEIQEWLFAQGYDWRSNKKEVLTRVFNYIFTDSFAASELTHIDAEDNFENHRNKEITLQRTVAVTLTPSFVEPVAESVEYVELGGKLYVKTDVYAALSSIVAIENDVVETCCECDNPIRRNRYASFKGKHYHIECL